MRRSRLSFLRGRYPPRGITGAGAIVPLVRPRPQYVMGRRVQGATGRDDDGGCEVADLNDQEVAEKIHSVQATAAYTWNRQGVNVG